MTAAASLRIKPRSPAQRFGAWLLGLPPAYAALALLMLAAAWMRPQLLSPMLLVLMLRQAAPLGLAVIGQSLVMRGLSLDLSFGGVVVGVSYILTSGALPWDAPALLALSLAFGLLVGAVNGFCIVGLRASSVIVTLGMTMIISGVVIALSQLRAPGDAPELLREIGLKRIAGLPLPVWVWLAALVPAALFMRLSVFGRWVDAWGASPWAALLSGIPAGAIVFVSHLASSLFAVVSGWMLLAFVGAGSFNLGQDLALNALAAAVLGGVNFGNGRGGLLGPAVAAFMLTFLFNFLTSLGVNESARLMLQGVLIALAAVAYSARHK